MLQESYSMVCLSISLPSISLLTTRLFFLFPLSNGLTPCIITEKMGLMTVVAMFAASQAMLYYTVKYMMKHLETGSSDTERQKQLEKGDKTLERLGLKDSDLDEYERMATTQLPISLSPFPFDPLSFSPLFAPHFNAHVC